MLFKLNIERGLFKGLRGKTEKGLFWYNFRIEKSLASAYFFNDLINWKVFGAYLYLNGNSPIRNH